jgi:hypothetical protein
MLLLLLLVTTMLSASDADSHVARFICAQLALMLSLLEFPT